MTTTIDQALTLDDLKLIKYLKDKDSPFIFKIVDLYEIVKEQLNNRIPFVFPNYTLHNTDHSLRIIRYMGDLIDDVTLLDDLEVTLLILSALMHDIGMAISDEDIKAIKADAFSFSPIKFSVMKKMSDDNDITALQEYVRRIHSSLSSRYILSLNKNYFTISELAALDFQKELAAICESHTMDYDWIETNLKSKEVKGNHIFNPQYVAAILRLGDILDIDSNRTPPKLYQLIVPNPISKDEWEQHFAITNYKKIITNEKTGQKKIVFHGTANNAHIHRKLLTYIGWVKEELSCATILVSSMPNQYNLIFDTNPEIHIQSEGYTYSNYQMTLQFKAISSLLMGEKIYGSNSLGLRELIQNSMDACRIRQEIEKVEREFGEDEYVPKIKIIIDAEKDTVSIRDNGIGMSLDVIKKHFLNIGVSYYNSTDFLLKDFAYKPIGNFGIGFLACFMLSDEVTVVTRYYKDRNRYLIELEKGNEYTSLTEQEDFTFEGTEVKLKYSQFIPIFYNKVDNVKTFLEQYFLFDGIDVELIDKSEGKKTSIHKNLDRLATDLSSSFKINLKDYIDGMEGVVYIKPKQPFIQSFKEIDFETENVYHLTDIPDSSDNEISLGLITDWSNYPIDNYINKETVKFLSVPIIEQKNEADFINGLKFTKGDVAEVIEKMEKDLKWISIVYNPKTHDFLYDDELSKRSSESDLFSELIKMGHCEDCPTKYFIKSKYLFEGEKNNLYLPFDDQDRDVNYSYYRNKKVKELYIRGVLIKDFIFNLPLLASVFEIQAIIVNIISKAFIPDISRNNVDVQTQIIINRLIGKAVHLGALQLLPLKPNEKSTLKNYIENYYSANIESKPQSDLPF